MRRRSRALLLAAVALATVGLIAVLTAGGASDADDEPAPATSAQPPAPAPAPGPGGPPGRKGPPDDAPAPEAPARTTSEPTRDPIDAGPEDQIAYPREVSPDGAQARAAVEAELGSRVHGYPTVIAADCRAGRCAVRYYSEPRGGGRVMQQQAGVLRRLFASRTVRRAILYVHHVPTGHRDADPTAFRAADCRRARHPRFAWERIGANDLRARCTVREQSGGAQRAAVRRGTLSVKDASRALPADGR